MRKRLFLLMTFASIALYGQTTELMEQVMEITGLDAENYLIQGFNMTERSQFLPERFRAMADSPVDIPLRKGVSALSPATLVPLLYRAGLKEENRVLIVGEEASYCATALSRAGMEIYLIDPTAEVSTAYSLKKDLGNLNGWISMAPFDFILCLNPWEEIPAQLLRQLSARGILVAPLISDDLTQCWFRAENSGGNLKLSMMGTASEFPLF